MLRVWQRETDAVVPEIDVNLLVFDLNAVDGGGEKDMFAVSQETAAGGFFPLVGELIEKFSGRVGRVGGDLELALVVCSDANGRLVLVLMDRDDLAEVDGKQLVLIQRHGNQSVGLRPPPVHRGFGAPVCRKSKAIGLRLPNTPSRRPR